ncbi:MAG: tape measure protein [Paludibacteraceae bacterium]|nr:tape measure protein [Paludibacteraceae bacterium]
MANESVKFTIELGGNAYSGVAQLDSAVQQVVKSVNKANGLFKQLGNTAFMFESVVGAVEKISSGLDSLVGSSLEFEQSQANMRTLMNGNAEAADALLSKIRSYGKSTVYDTSGLVNAQKTMMAFGLEADTAFKSLQHIGDIALGDSQKMQSLALAFAQAQSTGKLMGQDLMQMINAGFNPLEVISQRTGKSIATLKDEMSKGAISAQMVAQAFQWATEEGGRFYQGAETAAQTVSGRIAKMRDTVDEWKLSLFEATGGLTAYVAEVGKMIAQFAPLGPLVGKTFDWMRIAGVKAFTELKIGGHTLQVRLRAISIAAVQSGGMLKLMGHMGQAACRQISVAIMNIPIIGWIAAIIAVVIAVIAAIVKGIKTLWEKCYEFRVVIFTIWEAIKAIFTWIVDGLKSLWAGFQENIIDPIWGFITSIAGWINEHILQPVWNAILNVVNWINKHLVEPIKNAFASIGAWFSDIFGSIFDWFEKQFVNIYNKIAKVIPGMKQIAYEGRKRADESWAKDHPTTTNTTDNLINTVNAPLQTMQSSGGAAANGTTGNATTAVATGGTRNTEIHINIGDMIKQVTFNGTTRENQQEIERTFAECLNRVLGMAQVSI